MPLMSHERPTHQRSLELIDCQAGGDVSRIVLGGVKRLPGDSVRTQLDYLKAHGDGLRRLLLSEPYGNPAQSVNLVVQPGDARAQAGYIIMEAMGYPMYSGSNTICTVTALLQSGRIPIHAAEQTVLLESPAGITRIQARCARGFVEQVTTQGEAAYLAVPDLVADMPHYGRIRYDVVWSGGFYAMVNAKTLGFELVSEEESALAAFGHDFVQVVHSEFVNRHPDFDRVTPLPFLHFTRPVARAGEHGWRARGATYVHPHVICRSPTGTGTSARLAMLAERGQIQPGDWLETVSPRGNKFTGTLINEAQVHGHRGWDTRITGRAWALAHSEISIDLDDPMVDNHDLELMLAE